MILIAQADGLQMPFGDFVDLMAKLGQNNGLQIHTMHEDIFNCMHKI
jgi:ACT domain-containing protein